MNMLWLVLAFGFLGGCASQLNDLKVSLGVLSPYEVAVDELKKGQVIEARHRVVALKKDHPDYAISKELLDKKIEPARLKLLRYYARKGKDEEKKGNWAKAEEAYSTAAGLSIQPKVLLNYQRAMALKVRNVRFRALYQQLLNEDQAWLRWKDAYYPPTGMSGDDVVMGKSSETMMQILETRLSKIWSLSEQYTSDYLPEIAWLYADSYLRFKPENTQATTRKQVMSAAAPKEIVLGGLMARIQEKSAPSAPKVQVSQPKVVPQVSVAAVQKLMADGDWLSARHEAQLLRAQGNADGDNLLQSINDTTADLAAKAFKEGNLAFRLEKIDQAVAFWEQAVKWEPKEQTYIDSLRRGRQIQERLAALKIEEDPAEKKVEE